MLLRSYNNIHIYVCQDLDFVIHRCHRTIPQLDDEDQSHFAETACDDSNNRTGQSVITDGTNVVTSMSTPHKGPIYQGSKDDRQIV
jgi:hypothetical protein